MSLKPFCFSRSCIGYVLNFRQFRVILKVALIPRAEPAPLDRQG
jgi:hypothetical protein